MASISILFLLYLSPLGTSPRGEIYYFILILLFWIQYYNLYFLYLNLLSFYSLLIEWHGNQSIEL